MPNKVSFSAMRRPNIYDVNYKLGKDYNGSYPDKKIIETMDKLFPQPGLTKIMDIGAGDGRNTIPLAKKGHYVIANELSPVGRTIINQRACRENLPIMIKTIDHDILKKPFPQQVNAAIISHVTQYFNLDELNIALKNISASLSKEGILIFDALINKGEKKSPSRTNIIDGNSFFDSDKVIKAGEKSGLQLVEMSDYNEKGPSRSWYVDLKQWGGKGVKTVPKTQGMPEEFNIVAKFLSDLTEFFTRRRKVELKWFVFKKL